MIWLIVAWFETAESLRGPCACVEVATGEIAGGVVMKTGCPALEEFEAVRHAKIANPTAECSLRRRKARMWRLTLGSVMDLAIFMGSFGFSDEVRSTHGSAFVPTNAHQFNILTYNGLLNCASVGREDEILNVRIVVLS